MRYLERILSTIQIQKKSWIMPPPTKVYIDVRDTPPRDFPISKKDGETHGFTRGCGGCSSWFKGLGRQEQKEACRNRFREILKETQKMGNYEERRDLRRYGGGICWVSTRY